MIPSGSGVSVEDADLILRVVNGAIRTGGPLEAAGIAGKVSLCEYFFSCVCRCVGTASGLKFVSGNLQINLHNSIKRKEISQVNRAWFAS